MFDKITHAILPAAVVVCVTVMACLHVVDSTTALAFIGAASGYGALAVGAAKPRS